MHKKELKLNRENIEEFNHFIPDIDKLLINYVTMINNHLYINIVPHDYVNKVWDEYYSIELINVTGFDCTGISYKNLLRYEVRYESMQNKTLSRQLNNEAVLDYPQLLIWDKSDESIPKFNAVCEKIKVLKYEE